MRITYCECVFVALGIQYMQCACAILSSVACPDVQHFPKLSHIRHDFGGGGRGGGVIDHKMCVLFSSANSVVNISRAKKKCARYSYDQKCLVVLY
jgi:hypothetical protein